MAEPGVGGTGPRAAWWQSGHSSSLSVGSLKGTDSVTKMYPGQNSQIHLQTLVVSAITVHHGSRVDRARCFLLLPVANMRQWQR